jgi:hypothetical protein
MILQLRRMEEGRARRLELLASARDFVQGHQGAQ